jgi:hypothetical protein
MDSSAPLTARTDPLPDNYIVEDPTLFPRSYMTHPESGVLTIAKVRRASARYAQRRESGHEWRNG